VLSPCVTFRPEQKEWKKLVQEDAYTPTAQVTRAARRLMRDTGFELGVLYAGNRPPYAPRGPRAERPVEELERRFAL
jgi:2-oxoglutarate ferredoxin oxidoreductase subunit beta